MRKGLPVTVIPLSRTTFENKTRLRDLIHKNWMKSPNRFHDQSTCGLWLSADFPDCLPLLRELYGVPPQRNNVSLLL